METVKANYASRTIYGTEIRKGRVFTVTDKTENTITLKDAKGNVIFVSPDEFGECFYPVKSYR